MTTAAPAPVLHIPGGARRERAHLTRFMAWAGARYGRDFPDHAALHRWSVEEPQEFWGGLAVFAGLGFHEGPSRVLREGASLPEARWFEGAALNFAEHLLRFRDGRIALRFADETGNRGQLSYRELAEQVARCAAGLRRLGVAPGDRVAAVLPNGPEAVIAMLATTSLGAVWSSCSPDFGTAGVLDRFGQIGPKVLIACTGYHYGGRRHDTEAMVRAVAAGLPEPAALVLVGEGDTAPGALGWQSLCAEAAPLHFAAMPFDHPAFILYSSGTTGTPKCIVHGAGGTLLQHLKEHLLHVDLHREDRLFYYTTCGWMMWNWLVSGLACGATLVLYDGSPTVPDRDALWRLAAEEGITVFGTSPRYLAGCQRAGAAPGRGFDLSGLRAVLSTGAPLQPEQFDFVYSAVGPDLHLASISGGTDIVSCFVLGNPLLPVRRGEIQGPGLGMAVAVFDGTGRPLQQGRGELVCTRPFPSMPVGFWGDGDGSRFRAAYFDRCPGAWAHGDEAEWTAGGGMVIHGRADGVLNPGGVRIGTAEIYRAVATVPEVAECLAVGQRWRGDERVILFVVPAPGVALDEALAGRICMAIRSALTPRHVPAQILAVPELPRTRSGKLSELSVRAVVNGEAVANRDALANPECLAHFSGRTELTE